MSCTGSGNSTCNRVCIIVGFVYKDEDTLMSSSIDMFTVYEYFSTRGFRVIVLSDISFHSGDILKSIFSDKISSDIYSFVPMLPLGRDPLPSCTWKRVYDIMTLYSMLKSVDCLDVDKLVVYYTGHSERGGKLVCPDGNMTSFVGICSKLLSRCHPSVEALTITDTCFVGCDFLPFVHVGDRFVLRSLDNACEHCIIHLSSSMSDEESESNTTRSLFTRFLFKHLSEDTIGIHTLMRKIQVEISSKSKRSKMQTVGCSSSFDRRPILYSWLLKSGISLTCNVA